MEQQIMSEADREKYLSKWKTKTTDSKVIALVEEDMKHGLSQAEIDDYMDRDLTYEQRKAISEMCRKKFPRTVVGVIGRSDMDAEKMRYGMELYENNVGINEIKKAMAEAKNAHGMKKIFEKALVQAQKQIATPLETVEGNPISNEQSNELLLAVKALTDSIQSHTGNYEAIEQMLKQMETIRLDEAVTKNLTSWNETLEKENQEFREQLEKKQDEVNKGLQTMAQLRTENENLRKEMQIMQDRNAELEQQVSQKEETIQEQGQAILSKNYVIEKYKSEEEKTEEKEEHREQIVPEGVFSSDTNKNGIPVFYTWALVQDQKVLQKADIEYTHRKPSVFEGIMSKFAFKKKTHKDLVQLVINKELSPEQVNAIRAGLEQGLDDEQLELIINKNLTPEKMESIIRFAALQNSLKNERGGVS